VIFRKKKIELFLSNSFTSYLLEGPFQGFNISTSQKLGSFSQKLGSFQVVNLSFLSQPLGLGLGLNVNTSLSASKLGVKPKIDRRLWTNEKLEMMINL
jgi:hypothetical protein